MRTCRITLASARARPAAAVAAAVVGVAALATALPSAPPASGFTAASVLAPTHAAGATAGATNALVWFDRLETALPDAAARYRSILLLATTPDCVYCRRLKSTVITAPEIQALLAKFTLVETDVSDPQQAFRFHIEGVPTLIFLSSDGGERGRVGGLIGREKLQRILLAQLDQESGAAEAPADRELLSLLAQAVIPNARWADLATGMGNAELRDRIRERLRSERPFPRRPLVALLSHSRLAVRLGALELLEEAAGDDFGFDPWAGDADAPGRIDSLAAWKRWAETPDGSAPPAAYAALTAAQVTAYLRDLASSDHDRGQRAMRMLQQGGEGSLDELLRFRVAHPDLRPDVLRRLQEVEYAIELPPLGGVNPAALAHRLVFGNLDVQLRAIRDLARLGDKAIPVLQDFLVHNDALIRETAIDTLVAVGGSAVLPILEKAAGAEQDTDVLVAILRGFGELEDASALPTLTSYLASSNEDLAVAALGSIAKLDSRRVGQDVARCLHDPRWRVRAAATDAAAQLKLAEVTGDLEALLGDEESFVRYKAVTALAAVEGRPAARKLSALFDKEDSLKGPIIAALCSLDRPLPESFSDALQGKDPGVLLSVLQALEKCGSSSLALAARLAAHPDGDVACTAIGLLGRQGMDNETYRGQLSEILRHGSRDRRLAVLRSMRTAREYSYEDLYGGLETWPPDGAEGDDEPSEAGGSLVDALFLDFGGGAVSNRPAGVAAAPPAATNRVHMGDLFSAFGSTVAPPTNAPAATSATAGGDGATLSLTQQAKALLRSPDEELRNAAALALLRMRKDDSIPYLRDRLDRLTSAEREEIVSSMAGLRTPAALELLRRLVRDPLPAVRSGAGALLAANVGDAEWCDALFGELIRADAPIDPTDLFSWRTSRAWARSGSRSQLRRWIPKLLAESQSVILRNCGLVLLAHTARREDAKLITPWLQADNPWTRRAAWYALACADPRRFGEQIDTPARDASEFVRVVVPIALARDSANAHWVHYLDETHLTEPESGPLRGDPLSSFAPPARTNALAVLKRLADDPAPAVRLEAAFARLSRSEPVDANALDATLRTFPDLRAVGERAGEFLSRRYAQLDPDFAALLPYLKYARIAKDQRRKILAHFGAGERTAPAARIAARRTTESAAVAAATVAPAPAATGSVVVEMAFFGEHGCEDCARVEEYLTALRAMFPELKVSALQIGSQRGRDLNLVLSKAFGVPQAQRGIAPALFAAGGYLIKEEITYDRAAELIARSVGLPFSTQLRAAEAAAPPAVTEASAPRASRSAPAWALAVAVLLLVSAWAARSFVRRHGGAQRR